MDLSAQGHPDVGSQELLSVGASTAAALAEALDPGHVPLDDLADVIESFNAEEPGRALFRAGMDGTPLNVGVLHAFLVLYLRTWHEGGRFSLLNIVQLPPLVGEEAACERLSLAFEAAGELAALGSPGLHVDLAGLCERLDWLAGDSRAAGQDTNAAALWLPAAQLTPDATVGAGYAFLAGEAASRAGQPGILAAAASVRAIRLLRAAASAEPGADSRLSTVVVFDALDTALRHLAACEQPDEKVFAQLGLAFQAVPSVESLLPMMLAVFDTLRGVQEDQYPIELARPVWLHSLPELVEVLSRLGPALSAELARESLRGDDPDDSFAVASWATWSFDHPNYRRAVPHGFSMDRERDGDLARLVLRHESTHVLSMIGGLGVAIMALRAAVVELEFHLSAGYQRSLPQEFVNSGVAALGDPHPVAVRLAERQIELLGKVQVLQDIWNPWFEGIAVFGELSDDPTADDRDTIVGDLMTQLIDVGEEVGKGGEERRAAYARDRAESERSFADAQKRLGPERLQYYYWEMAGSKYVGGYLAVRSIVASWRAAGGPMSGHEAMRHLLHLTRFATMDWAVPDLGLPLGDFEAAATDAMLSWVRRLAAIDPADLRSSEQADRPFGWVDLRPVERATDAAAAGEQVDTLFQLRIDEALGPIGATARSSEVYFAQELLDSWVNVLTAMPVGRSTARFWLNRATGHLVYMVRVAEQRQDTGEPSYDLGTVPLEAETMAELDAAMVAHPFDRLTVIRFADLGQGISERQAGMNVIAFQLGGWIHVQPRGWRFGTDDVDRSFELSIRLRLVPPALVRMEAALLDAHAGAAGRTAAWLDRCIADGDGAGGELGAWYTEVAALAACVRDHDGSGRERIASRRLVELVVGDIQLAEAILDEGLRAFVRHDVPLRSAAYQVLHASGRAPAPATDLDLSADDPLRHLLTCGADGWDVVPMIMMRSDGHEEPR